MLGCSAEVATAPYATRRDVRCANGEDRANSQHTALAGGWSLPYEVPVRRTCGGSNGGTLLFLTRVLRRETHNTQEQRNAEHYRATGKRRCGEEARRGGGGGRIEKRRERPRREALARGVAKNGEDVSHGGGFDSVKQWTVYAEVQQTRYAQYQLRPAGPQRRTHLRYGVRRHATRWYSRSPFSRSPPRFAWLSNDAVRRRRG